MFDENAVRAVNARIDELLHQGSPTAIIDRHEFCPDHPQASVEEYRTESLRRKPSPGMILDAAGALALDLSRSWVIGDAPRDIEAGHAAGCATILLRQPDVPQSPAASEPAGIEPDFVAGSLSEALDLIERAASNPAHLPSPAPSGREGEGPALAQDRLHHLVQLAEQILTEIKRRDEQTRMEFSVTKLLAGVMQIVALAVLFVAYLNRNEQQFQTMMGVAIFLQLFTISLLLMGRDRES
jgi:hypothetical protein